LAAPETVPLAHRVIGSGPAILLVTGTGYPGRTWPADLLSALAERYMVVTFDHRGTGDSPATEGPYSTRLFAADALALLGDIGVEPAHVLGHSMGGRVAQWMALDGPDRVRTLILAASGPGQIHPSRPVARGIPLQAAASMIELGYEGYMRRQITTTFFTPEYVAENPERVQWLVDAFWSGRPPLEHYLKHVVARQEHQTAELLDRITMPTLALIGDRDTHVGGTGSHVDQSRYLAEHLPDAELRFIEGAAHGYFWSHTEESVGILRDWIDRHET
jgi:pimeloyl-ACP methyl ester carboxylesterase